MDLSADRSETITRRLKAILGDNVSISFQRDPSIIGGLIVRIGDRVIDNSVRTHLQQLQATLA